MSTTVAPTSQRLTTAKAVAQAISQNMAIDDRVFVLGEDIAAYNGVFDATEGLLDRFGPDRVMDTPISETAFIGAAVGAAMSGMRPIAELMFVDFFGVCMDQIYNHMAKIHYESGGEVNVPMVLMSAIGGGYSDGAQHSQCLYATFAHLPGMKVVVPSTPYDAKGLMISAIRDDSPVVYLFHKGLMGLGWMRHDPRNTASVPSEQYTVPIGKAAVRRKGSDVTVATISLMTYHAMDAAEQLAEEGIDVEVLDLRSLVPLDSDAIVESVRRTGRLVVVDEDYRSYGMTGEVIATALEGAWGEMKAAPVRLAIPDVPIPYSRSLEQYILPKPDTIIGAIRQAMEG